MPSLPPECLHLIDSHLAQNKELESLATLLHQRITGTEAVVKFKQFVRLLLTTSIPFDDYSNLIKALYEIDDYSLNDTTPSRRLQINYLE
ncbi:hypothetical protein BGZ81_011613 [Podila clonocystis]|nr:hypothetical protein BGZ81_011613 [Podila clonocystis]